jgi:hypothetical protein
VHSLVYRIWCNIRYLRHISWGIQNKPNIAEGTAQFPSTAVWANAVVPIFNMHIILYYVVVPSSLNIPVKVFTLAYHIATYTSMMGPSTNRVSSFIVTRISVHIWLIPASPSLCHYCDAILLVNILSLVRIWVATLSHLQKVKVLPSPDINNVHRKCAYPEGTLFLGTFHFTVV